MVNNLFSFEKHKRIYIIRTTDSVELITSRYNNIYMS